MKNFDIIRAFRLRRKDLLLFCFLGLFDSVGKTYCYSVFLLLLLFFFFFWTHVGRAFRGNGRQQEKTDIVFW